MTAEELLSDRARRYIDLSERYGRTAQCVAETFNELRELTIIEVYFMKSVRSLLSVEEMSGFVIYVEGHVDRIINSYSDVRGEYPAFLRCAMERLALNYLKMKTSRERICSSYVRYYLPYSGPVASAGPEEDIIRPDLVAERDEQCSPVAERLRYMCARRPGRQKKIFIFLCTVISQLPDETVERICRVFNFDREQTFAVGDYLSTANFDRFRTDRSASIYYSGRLDYQWAKVVDKETSAWCLGDRDASREAEACRRTLWNLLEASRKAKKKIRYSLIAEVLNLDTETIATAVSLSSGYLRSMADERSLGTDYSLRGFELLDEQERRNLSLPEFRPFDVFGISLIARPDGPLRLEEC